MSAPNWRDDITVDYELFTITPTYNGADSIARSRGKWTAKFVWFEWCKASVIQKCAESELSQWVLTSPPSPTKVSEALDLFNATIVAHKRTVT